MPGRRLRRGRGSAPRRGWLRARSTRPSASGGRPRPAWIRIGTPPVEQVQISRISSPSNPKSWARGCSSMPRAPAARQRSPSATGSSAGSSRQNVVSRPSAFPRPGHDSVIGHAVGRPALGVVQREHARVSRAGRVELGEQLLGRERAAVLVQAQMGVGVDHFGVSRPQAGDFVEKRRERIGIQRLVHRRAP